MKKILLNLLFVAAGLLAAGTLALGARMAQARLEVEREWREAPGPVAGLQATTRLEIVPLYDEDYTNPALAAGHGVSYLIRTDALTLLLDVGNNPAEAARAPFAQNMEALGIAWEEAAALVISHPHPDHLGGVAAWRSLTLGLGEPGPSLDGLPVFAPVPLNAPGAMVVVAAQPALIGPDAATTGAIGYPEVLPINLFTPKGAEQGVVVNVAGRGLVLITGCGHPTLERLAARAEAAFGAPLIGVVGGLHYEGAGAAAVQPHIEFLAARRPGLVALSPHDSSPEAIAAFQAAFPQAYQSIRVGETIRFP